MMTKNIAETGWFLTYPRLGAAGASSNITTTRRWITSWLTC